MTLQYNANATPQLNATRFASSAGLGWKNISVDLYDVRPTSREEWISTDHRVILFTSVARGETSISQHKFAPYTYHQGFMNLNPSGRMPACRLFTTARLVVCRLTPHFVRAVAAELGLHRVLAPPRKLGFRDLPMQGLILLLAAEASARGSTGKLYADHLAQSLAVRWLRLSEDLAGARFLQRGKMPRQVLTRVLERMKADLATNLDLDTLAAESGYSRSHFLRLFRANTGCSPHQWLTHLRIEQAKILLRRGSIPLLDIGVTCGFGSNAHFSNRFRQIVGVTPSAYRKSPLDW